MLQKYELKKTAARQIVIFKPSAESQSYLIVFKK
jgi:hypothetical protein